MHAALKAEDAKSAEFNARFEDHREHDFSGRDLASADLSYTDLTGANLRGAQLSGANLTGTRLSRADLSGADLSGAQLIGTDLTGAILHSAILTGARIEKASLVDSDLTRVQGLETAGGSSVILGHTWFSDDTVWPAGLDPSANEALISVRRSAPLVGQALNGLCIQGLTLTRIDLSNANLSNANLREVQLKSVQLTNAQLQRADLRGADLRAAEMTGVRLTGALHDDLTRWPRDLERGLAPAGGAREGGPLSVRRRRLCWRRARVDGDDGERRRAGGGAGWLLPHRRLHGAAALDSGAGGRRLRGSGPGLPPGPRCLRDDGRRLRSTTSATSTTTSMPTVGLPPVVVRLPRPRAGEEHSLRPDTSTLGGSWAPPLSVAAVGGRMASPED